MPLDKRDLLGDWMHSHEEDTNGLTVFRPSTFAFPLSRGRKSFALRANGTYKGTIPGPTDRPAPTAGRWSFAGTTLTLSAVKDGSESGVEYTVVECVTGERLVVKRPG
ncbi:MAG: hypothetical protein ACKVQU_27745 [Burkholderiales bacterium]